MHANNDSKTKFACFRKKKTWISTSKQNDFGTRTFHTPIEPKLCFWGVTTSFFCKISAFFTFSWFSPKIGLAKCIQIMIQRRHSRVFLRKKHGFRLSRIKIKPELANPSFSYPYCTKAVFLRCRNLIFFSKIMFLLKFLCFSRESDVLNAYK